MSSTFVSRLTAAALCTAMLWNGTLHPAAAAPGSAAAEQPSTVTASASYAAAVIRHREAISAAVTARAAAKMAAERVREATSAELTADKAAASAARTVRKLARQQYIAGGSTDLETVAVIASGGPDTLTDISRAQTIRQRVDHDAAAAAQDALDGASAAAQATKRAIEEHAAAAAAVAAADAEVVAAEGDANAAAAAYEHARSVAGCAVTTVAPISPAMEASGRRIAGLLTAEGFTLEAVAAILGNLQQESELDPTKRQLGGGPGRGLAQWTEGGRWDVGNKSLAAYAKITGGDMWSLKTQVGFMLFEMRDGWGGFNVAMFAASKDTVDAAVYFHDVYERSADSADFVREVRGGNAKLWFVLLNGGDPGSCGTRPAAAPEGLPMVLPDGWTRWEVPGGSGRLHPDARRVAQYVHATIPSVTEVTGWRDGPRGEHSDGLSVDFAAPAPDAARIAEMFARFAAQFGVEKVRYNGREFTAGSPATGWESWPPAPGAVEGEDVGVVHVAVWGNRNPERNAPYSLWVGR